MKLPKLVVIVGPTASGKTGLSIELAKQFDGEIISADSRQVYRGMDIGTAKVTKQEMAGVPHHLLDIIEPTEVYTASDFKRDANHIIYDMMARNKLPIIAGGTFFYIDSLLGKVSIPEVPPDNELRDILEKKSNTELFSILEKMDPDRAKTIESENPRRLIRAIEVATVLGKVPINKKTDSIYDTLTIGLSVNMENHGEIINKRILKRLDSGMIDEVNALLQSGVTHERLESFGLEYRYISRYLRGILNYDEMVKELTVKSRQFAKRQMTWLKRDKNIHWFQNDDPEISTLVKNFCRLILVTN